MNDLVDYLTRNECPNEEKHRYHLTHFGKFFNTEEKIMKGIYDEDGRCVWCEGEGNFRHRMV